MPSLLMVADIGESIMAFKPNSIDRAAAMQYSSDTVDNANPPTFCIKINDAEYGSHSYENKTVDIILQGVDLVDIGWDQIRRILSDNGVEDIDCDYLTEQFADMAFQHLMAKALAKRIRRI